MTDSEKLDLILEKISTLDEKATNLEKNMIDLEKDMIDVKSDLKQLHRGGVLILDEVERVQEILLEHMNDTAKHTA